MSELIIERLNAEIERLKKQLAGEVDGRHVNVRHECDEDMREAINYHLNRVTGPASIDDISVFFRNAAEEYVDIAKWELTTYLESVDE